MTRAVEIAPGFYVGNPDEVVFVSDFPSEDGVTGCFLHSRSGGVGQITDAAASEVAAKLWPGESGSPPDIATMLSTALNAAAAIADGGDFDDAYESLEASVERVMLGCI